MIVEIQNYCTSTYYVSFLASYFQQTPCQCRIKNNRYVSQGCDAKHTKFKVKKNSCVLFSFTVPEFKIHQHPHTSGKDELYCLHH